jgi:adenylosuccinate lyase
MDYSLNAVSPVDGRYRKITEPLAAFFSEGAIIRYRLLVEVEYFIALCKIPLPQLKGFDKRMFPKLRNIYERNGQDDALRIKEIEQQTNHDVKAVEYFMKEQFEILGIGKFREFVHFGLTSQDINNTAFPLAMRNAWRDTLEPLLENIYGNC